MTESAIEMQLECAALVNRLYLMLDDRDETALERIFAADAQWVRLGRRTIGLSAIRESLNERPVTTATRHVISNAVIDADGPDRARGSFYMTVVRRADTPVDAPRPVIVPGPWRLSVVRSQFRRTVDGWRIAEQITQPAFEFADGVSA